MTEVAAEKIDLPEWPDLEEFLIFCQESRIDGPSMKALVEYWGDWLGQLRTFTIKSGKKSWLAVWLPEEIEQQVDAVWTESPSRGFQANALAQFLCMSAIREKLPPVAEAGCAPAPEPTLALKEGLAKAGLDVDADTGLLRRKYAIVTWFPFRGGCEVCSLRENCPKGSGKSDFANILIPGYEKE